MTTLTVTVPEDLAIKAKSKGLLSSSAIVALLREKIEPFTTEAESTPAFDPRFKGKASPDLVGSVKINGDIVAPLDIQWEANS